MSNRERYEMSYAYGRLYVGRALQWYKMGMRGSVEYELFKKEARKDLQKAKELRLAGFIA